MAALTTIELLEQAVGRALTADEEEQVGYYIDLISEYIISYTGISFESAEQTARFKADYYGIVELPGGPVAAVEVVAMWRSGSAHPRAQWDGLNEIYGLNPVEVVDVTYTSGYTTIPDDISMVATEAVKNLFETSGSETGPLTRYRVGDVEKSFRATDISTVAGLFNDLDKLILDQYRTTETTWRVGFAQPNNLDTIPSGPNALYE